MTRVAILDDYQGVARRMADWASLPAGTEVVVFADHLKETGCGGRPTGRLRRGGGHARADPVSAAAPGAAAQAQAPGDDGHAQRVHRRGRGRGARDRRLRDVGAALSDGGADVGAHPRPRPPHPGRGSRDPRGPVAGELRARPERQDPRRHRARRAGLARGQDRPRLRDGRDRLEPEPHGRARRRGGGHPRDQGRAAGPLPTW